MTPKLTVLEGNCYASLLSLPAKSVHCAITSPPYWAQRDYKIPSVDWEEMEYYPMVGIPPVLVPAMSCPYGMEPTIHGYIAHSVAIFERLKRVLRDDGTFWLNLGDKSCGSGAGNQGETLYRMGRRHSQRSIMRETQTATGLKNKDLMGLPWRVALALQAAGWYLRLDCIWNKPNPMPESCVDRPTKAHEYFFLLSKRPRYYYDIEATKEKASENTHLRVPKNPAGWAPTGTGRKDTKNDGRYQHATAGRYRVKQNVSFSAAVSGNLVSKRNKRSVWTVVTQAFKGNHFATFPPNLIRPCIRAGTSIHGCCADCGAPYQRIVAKGKPDVAHQRACGGDANGHYNGKSVKDYDSAGAQDASETKARILAGMCERITTGWQKTCRCKTAERVPATVLDPFGGAFTTGMVALQEGRNALMLEINPEYIALGNERCAHVKPFQEPRPKKPKKPAPDAQLTLLQ
jgi:DNA modification methylase